MINHSTVLIQLDGLNILTDPVYSPRVGPFSWVGPRRHRDPGIPFDELPPIHAVLISHNHYDHLDLPTLGRLAERHRPRILVPLGNTALLESEGIAGGEDMDWWQSTTVGTALRVTLVPARHWSGRGLDDRFRTLWGGFVIEGSGGPVYFAGDTGWGRHFAEIRRRFGPMRLALLPIGAYQPRWFMKAAHISPAEAVRAHLTLGAGTSLAIHYGTFQLSDEGQDQPLFDLRRAVSGADMGDSQFWALQHGEARDVPLHPAARERLVQGGLASTRAGAVR
jgi:L-ascorbate metabolism protein UlaG (beta-lactamase superfamily)